MSGYDFEESAGETGDTVGGCEAGGYGGHRSGEESADFGELLLPAEDEGFAVGIAAGAACAASHLADHGGGGPAMASSRVDHHSTGYQRELGDR